MFPTQRRKDASKRRKENAAYLNAKLFLYKSRVLVAGIIAKFLKQEYTPALTCPPSQKVSQVEIEAGDSEGRLPHIFWELKLHVVLATLRAQ